MEEMKMADDMYLLINLFIHFFSKHISEFLPHAVLKPQVEDVEMSKACSICPREAWIEVTGTNCALLFAALCCLSHFLRAGGRATTANTGAKSCCGVSSRTKGPW
jgi:hypothetical protein